jgi:hypothetical protein
MLSALLYSEVTQQFLRILVGGNGPIYLDAVDALSHGMGESALGISRQEAVELVAQVIEEQETRGESLINPVHALQLPSKRRPASLAEKIDDNGRYNNNIQLEKIRAGEIPTYEEKARRASMLQELSKLQAGIILASSGSEGGFAHSAITSFLQKLPSQTECWHFGDSDAKGFEILHNLRERVQIPVRSLHMYFRPDPESPLLTRDEVNTIDRLLTSPLLNETEKQQLRAMRDSGRKGRFEQESLGLSESVWPFYAPKQTLVMMRSG